MRRARLTYDGAFHHGMNRGYDGRPIFGEGSDKKLFVDLMGKVGELTRVSVLAYTIMDNHYHLVLQNTNNRMSEFFKQLNGQFGSHFRQRHGGRGYVFQDRYKSMMIQDDAYLMLAIAYVLNNPVSAGLVEDFRDYKWSSGEIYFSDSNQNLVSSAFVEDLFESRGNFEEFTRNAVTLKKLPIVKTQMGTLVGGEEFVPFATSRADRRTGRECLEMRREEDRLFEPVEKVMDEFQRKYGITLQELDTRERTGKRLRVALLVHLKERAGLSYRQIAKMDLFGDLSINSLGPLYHRHKTIK